MKKIKNFIPKPSNEKCPRCGRSRFVHNLYTGKPRSYEEYCEECGYAFTGHFIQGGELFAVDYDCEGYGQFSYHVRGTGETVIVPFEEEMTKRSAMMAYRRFFREHPDVAIPDSGTVTWFDTEENRLIKLK